MQNSGTFNPFEPSAEELLASQRLREATAAKRSGDWHKAIEILCAELPVLAAGRMSYPVETYLRLPLYLQQAGRYLEALGEFKALMDGIEVRVAREMRHLDQQKQAHYVQLDREMILAKMKLAAKRELKRRGSKPRAG